VAALRDEVVGLFPLPSSGISTMRTALRPDTGQRTRRPPAYLTLNAEGACRRRRVEADTPRASSLDRRRSSISFAGGGFFVAYPGWDDVLSRANLTPGADDCEFPPLLTF
jgi:hypothetical protein